MNYSIVTLGCKVNQVESASLAKLLEARGFTPCPPGQPCEVCIINTCASVDHDCDVADFVHVSVGAHVAGTCTIGERTWIGAGATVSNNITICPDCMIGAGGVVIRNICEKGTYVGSPVRKIK